MSSSPLIYGKDEIYRSPRPPIFLPNNNISMIPFLFRNLSLTSNTTALIDAQTAQTLTFSHLKTHVLNLSHALINHDISKNDVVLILSPNSVLFPVAFFAVVAVGAIATTANPLYTTAELSKQIKDSNPKLIITTHQLHHKVKHFNLPCLMLTTDLIDHTITNAPALIRTLELPSNVVQTDPAAILYSSGTAGTRKGVVLTHRNFIASALMMTSDQETNGESNINKVFLCFLPMFHIFGLSALMYAQLQRGNRVVVMEKHEIRKTLMAIEKYKVTHMFVVPIVIRELVKNEEVVKKYDVSSLREILSGATPLGKDVIEECTRVFPHVVMYQAYGMTETTGVISLDDPRTCSPHLGSTGVLAPTVEAQIVKLDTMKPLPPFQRGEIWVRGPLVMKGYLNNMKATMDTIDERGWLHTGDIGYFDDKGRLYVVDRVKELIKYKGFQVAPAELEELLLTHPQIVDAAVIGLADAEAGEIPVAFVVRSTISSLTKEQVYEFIAEQVAPFKRLKRVIFTDGIPKSPSGKILRRVLKQNLQSKL